MNMDNDQTEQTEDQPSPETVRLAKDMGWKDPADWQGDPPKNGFVSPAEFVRRSEKVLPIVAARAKKAEDEVAKLRTEIEQTKQDHRDTIKRIERMTDVALANQRTQIEAQYAARKEAAVETGDKVAYQQAVKDEKEATKALDERLKDDEPEAKKPGDDKKLPAEVQETINVWLKDNEWFNTDLELNAVANARYAKLEKEKPGLTVRQRLESVREYVAKKYPEQFGEAEEAEEERPRASRVEGGSRMNGGSARKGYASLPADAKAAADKYGHLFLKPGETMDKDGAKAKDRYAAQYNEENQ